MEHLELTTEQQVLKRDIPWETYMSAKLITGTCLQLLRRYDKRSESYQAALLDDDGPAYIRVFVNILRDISEEETLEYVLALIDEMLTGATSSPVKWNFKWLIFTTDIHSNINRLLLRKHNTVESTSKFIVTALKWVPLPMIDTSWFNFRLMLTGNLFMQEKSCKILTFIVSIQPESQEGRVSKGEASYLKGTLITIDDVLQGLVDWLCSQLKDPSHPSHSFPVVINCLAALLREPLVRASFVQADGIKLLIPLISPASTQKSIQLYYDAAVDYLATKNVLPRLVEVVKSSTKEKVVRVIILTFRNLLAKGTFGAQMVDLGLPQIIQSLKAQAWSDEILRVLKAVLDTSNGTTAVAVACYDLSQFLQYHPAGRIAIADLKGKDMVMKLLNHENAEVTKNALLCLQRLFLGTKYAGIMQS